LLVTNGSRAESKNIGANRSTRPSIVSLRRLGNVAPLRSAWRTASRSAEGSSRSKNFLAVRLLYGPVLIQNSFV
jgi:hypothetical protein